MRRLRVNVLIAVPRACKHAHTLQRQKKRAMREKERERGAPTAKEGSIKDYKFLLSLQSIQGVA